MSSLDAVRARFARNEGLPFADVLTEANIREVLNDHGVPYRNRVFSPVTTIWGFLSQVLSEDHSCRDAVSRIIAHRAANGITVCSPNTASYCNARSRIPTSVLSTLARRTAEELQTSVDDQWKWNGCSVFILDGSSVSMPDTPENQAMYPQPPQQAAGIGFPLARIAVLLSLATGACHDLAIAPYEGKGTGETSLFRRMYDTLKPGDVVLADALFDDYFIACELRNRGIDLVAHAQYERTGSCVAESRPDDDILAWQRPNKPRGMAGEQYRSYPKQLLMRQVTVDARDKNNRVQQFKVVTTILTPSIDGKQIGALYEHRWEGEVDIRSIKCTMQMDILRCKTPDMVHKEIWTHLLAYNLLRTVMAVAANENDIEPRKLSFKGAKQALTAFAPKIEAAQPEDRGSLIDAMLTTIAYHRVGDRPGRWEPRARKRRPKPAARLTQPRHIAKLPHNRSKWF
jgi:DDE family transposase